MPSSSFTCNCPYNSSSSLVSEDGKVYCCGFNDYEKAKDEDDGEKADKFPPVLRAGDGNFRLIAAGGVSRLFAAAWTTLYS